MYQGGAFEFEARPYDHVDGTDKVQIQFYKNKYITTSTTHQMFFSVQKNWTKLLNFLLHRPEGFVKIR